MVDLRIKKDSTRPKKSADKSRWKFTKEGFKKFKDITNNGEQFCKVVKEQDDIDMTYKKWSKKLKGVLINPFIKSDHAETMSKMNLYQG